ncbi:MAG: hypothetical protein LH650_07885, partial [Chloroflexi bacterium]|nr:hypothetical protein [Chloroflexota bacterium]
STSCHKYGRLGPRTRAGYLQRPVRPQDNKGVNVVGRHGRPLPSELSRRCDAIGHDQRLDRGTGAYHPLVLPDMFLARLP